MGFLDEIKSRLPFGHEGQGGYGSDDYGYYDDDDAASDGGYGNSSYPAQGDQDAYGDSSAGVLGQTRRGEAESVAVYTRSGQLVGEADRHATTYNPPARSQDVAPAYRPGAYDTPSSYAESRRAAAAAPAPAAPGAHSAGVSAETAARMSAIANATPQLPAYILKPESYDDVETVVRRVRTRQPVALVFQGVRTEVAKRVLDFSYGFACGLGASVREAGDRVFVVLPEGCELKDSDVAKLRSEGYLK